MELSVHKAVVLFTLLIVYANSQLKFQVSGLNDEAVEADEAGEAVLPPNEQIPLPRAPVTDSEDCTKLVARSDGALESGVYVVQPLDGGPLVQVYCDMETDGGGWTVFQRRQDGSVDFYRNFSDYRQGFGNLKGEFWLGNDNLHRFTAQGVYELRVDLAYKGKSTYAVYDTFAVGALEDSYRLQLGNYSGYAGDSMSYSNDQQFTTLDQDRDKTYGNCAVTWHGAWWFQNCFLAHLNGEYGATEYGHGVLWNTWKGYGKSLKRAEMKIRKKY